MTIWFDIGIVIKISIKKIIKQDIIFILNHTRLVRTNFLVKFCKDFPVFSKVFKNSADRDIVGKINRQYKSFLR